ncbi:MAG: SUMF1/EgtB/PvdO family nonheme iron enzyme, partial [Flavobacteriales bacterium]
MKSVVSKLTTVALLGAIVVFSSCEKSNSGATGWSYNDPKNGGFERPEYVEQETGPGLVLIEGGTFTMGRVEDDVNFTWDNIPRRVTVSSFYMDEVEVTNQYWRDYLYWLGMVYGDSYPEIINKALPDTLVWREKMEYNEPYVDYYLRHPAYSDYPVVGVNWLQANDYCAWRTDRVNELILIREGLLVHN